MLGLVRTEALGSFQIRLTNDGYTRPTGNKAASNLQALTLRRLDIRQSALARLELPPLLEHEMFLIRQTHGDGVGCPTQESLQAEVCQAPQPPPSGARQALRTVE
jgi:hypothetical protein